MFYLERRFSKRTYEWIVVVGLFVFGLLETSILPFRLPWSADTACVGLGYFYFGGLMRRGWNSKIMMRLKSIQTWIYCVVLLCAGCSIMMNGIQNMRTGEYACILLSVINSIISVVAIWILVYRASPIVDEKLGNAANEIKRIGQYSVIWLCCNEIVINMTGSIMNKLGIQNLLAEVLVVLVILRLCEKLFTMTPLCAFVGFSYAKKPNY